MEIPTIRIVGEADRRKAIVTLLLGFSGDPFMRWLNPRADLYLEAGPSFDAFGGRAIDNGSAYVANEFEGVAFWMPPGVESDEDRFIEEVLKFVPKNKHETMFKVLEAMEEYHPKDAWYLPIIGVDPAYQGKGIGSFLMKKAIERVDSEGLAAYLESSNPLNMSLYERCGFETMGQIQIGDCPVIHPMIRAKI